MKESTLPAVAVLVIAAVFPFVTPTYWVTVSVIAYYYALVAMSWTFVAGFCGQFSFAQAAMASIGAYALGFLSLGLGVPPVLCIFAGGAMAALASYALGLLCLRLKGPYLALTTLAFSEAFRLIMSSEWEVTRGTLGLNVPALLPEFGISNIPPYLLMLVILAVSILIMHRILSSKLGLFFRSIREDEDAASAMGVDVKKYKLVAFTVGGFFAGIAGAFYGSYIQIVSPNIGSLSEMGLVVSMVVMGGTQSLGGAVLGAITLEFLSEYLRLFGELWKVLFASAIILTLRFSPKGLLMPLLKRLLPKPDIETSATKALGVPPIGDRRS